MGATCANFRAVWIEDPYDLVDGAEIDAMRSPLIVRLVLALLTLLAVGTPGRAENFYQGKQLVVLVNFPPGGPTDFEARLLARTLARTIVGSPAVVVQNMGGSNGAVAANWLANAAASDGLILGYFSGIASMRALADPILSENVAKLAFAAAVPGVGVTYARTDIGGGIGKPLDVVGKRDLWLGGLRPDSDRDLRLRMQFDLLGVKHGYQPGFSSIADARQAFLRGDIQVLLESLTAYRTSIEGAIVASGKAMPLWIDPLDDGETFIRSMDADNLPAPTFTDVLLQAKGALPKSELFEAWRMVNQMGTLFQRILLLAPATPPAAVTALRKAIGRFADDAAFKEDALKSIKQVPTYLIDARTASLFTRVATPEPAQQAFLRKYIEQVAPDYGKEKAGPPAEAMTKPAQ